MKNQQSKTAHDWNLNGIDFLWCYCSSNLRTAQEEMEWKDCKEEILQSKKEVGGEWRGLRSVNVKKDLRNEKVKKKRDKDGE